MDASINLRGEIIKNKFTREWYVVIFDFGIALVIARGGKELLIQRKEVGILYEIIDNKYIDGIIKE